MLLAIATIALVAAPRASQAQFGLVKPFQLGVAGGATQPMSTLKDGANMGFNGTVALGINVPLIPLGLRVDGAYNQFGEKAGVGAKLHVISATGNLVWSLPLLVVSPYLIGGAGLYRTTATSTGTVSATQTDNHFGWNAGAGVKLPLSVFKAFVEARYNRVTTNTGSMQFVPLTVGIMF